MHGGVCGCWALIFELIAPYTGEKFVKLTPYTARNGQFWVLTRSVSNHSNHILHFDIDVWSIIDPVVANSIIR